VFHTFHGSSADELWLAVAAAFKASTAHKQQSRAGQTREIFRVALSVEDPRQRWVVSRSPPLNPAFALAEVIWILAGRNDARFLTFFNRQLPAYCGTEESLHGAYGFRLRRHFGFDQLERAAAALQHNPDSRQVALQIWDPVEDLPQDSGQPRASDIPCNVFTLLKIRSGKLELTEVLRSNDVFRGLPYNLVQFTTLQEVLAGWIGVELGTYGQVVDSVHVYEDALADVALSAPVPAHRNTDTLALPKRVADLAWAELARLIDRLVDNRYDKATLVRAPHQLDAPVGFTNVASILCAEAARRMSLSDAAEEIIAGCTNPALRQLWHRWTSRFSENALASRRSG
jgi:thymidylate synthase